MKKVVLFIFVFCLFISNVKATKLVSLGDSIPNGYLLSDEEDSYDNLLADTLDLDFYEHSYIGMRSDDLLRDLEIEEVKNNIKDADIITINIGSNDLLDLLDYLDLSDYDFEIEYGENPSFDRDMINSMISYIEDYFKNELEVGAIGALEDYKIIFPRIIAKIKEYNPEAKIYVNSLYNPFANVSVPLLGIDLSFIETIADNAITSFNDVIYSYDDYTIIDVYHTLDENKYLNVNPLQGQLDPHPNITGHKKIYELYLKELAYKVVYEDETYYVLKGGKLDIEPEKKEGYTFKKWNYDLNHIDKDIELKAIYKKNINYYLIGTIVMIILLIIFFIIKRSRKK